MRVLLAFLCLFAAPVHAFPVQRCINLGNGLDAPAEGDWSYVIERGHLSAIAAAGFDTIRLPVRFSAHWNGRIEPSFLARVDEVIGWAREDGLRVILDLHHFEELMQNPDAHRDAFLSLWKELSAHYRDASDDLIFELLNEPTGSLTTEKAVALFSLAMPIIRTENPDRWVIISGGNWSDEAELAALPVFDDRTVHTFHFYKPWEFTHQQADWLSDPPPPSRWGTEADRREMLKRLSVGLNHRVAPVFLGEFGVYDAAPDEDARAWGRPRPKLRRGSRRRLVCLVLLQHLPHLRHRNRTLDRKPSRRAHSRALKAANVLQRPVSRDTRGQIGSCAIPSQVSQTPVLPRIARYLRRMLLDVRNLTKRFPGADGPIAVLDGVSFSLDRGETLALTGESGSGKSTLLHIIGGLEPADEGMVTLDGTEITGLDDRGRAALRRMEIGIVFQQFNLIPSLTVAQNITFQARLAGREDKARSESLIAALGLQSQLRKYPEELSGGQQQRVAIARAILPSPKLVLADEPTGNLDENTADAVFEALLDQARSSGAGLLLVTHSERLAARADRRLHLSHGRLQS